MIKAMIIMLTSCWVFDSDHELPDFASEAAGGAVLDTPDTESYHKPDHQQITFFGIPIWEAGYFTPRKVIQPWTQAGECWAFRGSNGKILLKLARAAYIDKVTLEHIPVSASLTGSINSAPRDFSVHLSLHYTPFEM
ncbi:SUN domain-containing protein 1-like [Diprion similis]|uniref:SUN domain-containing protein 1-like n=1 Tax=Diprion similis TaxID=362088 RepID=UPI001EF85C8C|nr:SUN domain-containing protein 1-like [Diprion similis]